MKFKITVAIMSILAVAGLCLMAPGCATKSLDTTGIYGSGQALGTNAISTVTDTNGVTTSITNAAVETASLFLANFDSDLGAAENTLDALLSAEKNNRALLLQWPAIKQTADTIRANVPKWTKALELQRDAYASMPNAANASALSIGITQITTASSTLTPLLSAHITLK
jgi:hypothetical protein